MKRRDLLRLAGGSALGFALTPIPWKLVDDSAIWTQNWSLTPSLPRGPVRSVCTACTICPGGCPVKARTVGGVPVALSGLADHPAGDGFLCPVGLAGHHLAYHPLRIHRPWMRNPADGRWRPAEMDEVVAAARRAMTIRSGGTSLAVLDRRPGRAASAGYRRLLERAGDGLLLVTHHDEAATLRVIRSRTSPDPGPLGFDLERVGAILSIGAPLLEGWGNPARMRRLLSGGTGTPLLIQVDRRRSATLRRADVRVLAAPGSETNLVLGIAREVLRRQPDGSGARSIPDLERFRADVERYTPEFVAARTGVDPGLLASMAGALLERAPAVVVEGADAAAGPAGRGVRDAAAALNVVLGSVGRPGGILPRGPIPGPGEDDPGTPLCDAAAGSAGLLLVDDAESGLAIPYGAIRRVVDPEGGMIVAFSPWLAGVALAADAVIPVPAPYESLQEVLSPATDPRPSVGLSAPLLNPRITGQPRDRFLAGIAGPDERGGVSLDDRISAIALEGKGTLEGPGHAAGSAVPGLDDLRSALIGGARWLGEDPGPGPRGVTRIYAPDAGPAWENEPGAPAGGSGLTLIPFGARGSVGNIAVPGLIRKIYQESGLKRPSGHALVHPATASARGIPDNGRARIVTASGGFEVTMHHDPLTAAGVIELSCGPALGDVNDPADPLAACALDADGCWGETPAELEAV